MTAYDNKKQFIINYLLDIEPMINVFDSNFVDQYHAEFPHLRIGYQPYGAHVVPDLTRTLKRMFDDRILKRTTWGLGNVSGLGFPKWCWMYSLRPSHAQYHMNDKQIEKMKNSKGE